MHRAFADVHGSADSFGSTADSQGNPDDATDAVMTPPVSLFSSPTRRALTVRPNASVAMRRNSQLAMDMSSAQKDVDDPTTPFNSQRDTEATISEDRSLIPSDVSRMLSTDMSVDTSRIPSYINASGPLYARGRLLLARTT
jgi:hypothetical protein